MKRAALLFFACLLAVIANAQNPPKTGLPPFASVQRDSFDALNRANLNVNFSTPIVNSPARGSDFSFSLVYDSWIWLNNGTGAWVRVTDASGQPSWGWKTDAVVGSVSWKFFQTVCGTWPNLKYVNNYGPYYYMDTTGTLYTYLLFRSYSQCTGQWSGATTGYASDNSGFYVDVNAATFPIVYDPSGTQFLGSQPMIDANGNYVSKVIVSSTETHWKDTVGRISLKVIKNTGYTDYQYLDTAGTYQTVRLTYQTFSIKTNFACSGVVEYTGSASLPVSLTYLANNTSYSFTYEVTPGFPSYRTGRLKRVTLPTGGYYEYTYPTSPNNGINCADGSAVNLTRVVNDGTTSNTWQDVRNVGAGTTTVMAPQLPYDAAANQTVFTFNTNGRETSQQVYQGTTGGTLLRTINTTYAANNTPATVTVITENNQQMQVATTFDSNGLLQSMSEYDWGSGAPGAALRTTSFTYLSGSAYTARNIINQATQKIVREGGPNGTIRSREDTSYDGGTLTCVTGAIQHDDSGYGCSFTSRGNATAVTTYTDPATPSGGIAHGSYYDSLGNVRQADVDCCNQKVWNYSAATQYAWPDSETCGAPGGPQTTTSKTYNFNTGLVATETDENNKVTSYAYDTLRRITDIARPDSSHITYSYDDVARTTTVANPIQGANKRKEKAYLDGLGREIKRQTLDASNVSYSIVETQYDGLGRGYRASNAHNSTPQYWTEARFDALGRRLKVIPPDGSPAANNFSFAYAGNTVTSTDPAGKQRKLQFDAADRTAVVYEPDVNNGNALTQQTSYSYSVFDSLASLTQGSLTRTITYDGLGRVSSEWSPESGTTSYQYNGFSLRTQRTDARGVVTTYSYDTLNRPTQISYNVGTSGVPATATVTYTYGTSAAQNNNGRLLTMTDGVGSETYSYDVMGRTTQVQKLVNGATYPITFNYNDAAQIISLAYPSGRIVQQNYDAVGRLCSVGVAGSSCSSGTTYANALSYNTENYLTGFSYGNGVTATFAYDPQRPYLTSLNYTKSGQTLFSVSYGYSQGGGNNGQVTSVSDAADSGRSVAYSYDALGRLSSATTTGSPGYPQWGLSFAYDRFGSRTSQSQTSDGPPTNFLTMSANSNLIYDPVPPYTSEARGNMTGDGANTLNYDAENRMVTSTGGSSATYTYDGNGFRVQKVVSGGATTVYIFAGGKVVAEYDNGALPASPSREYIRLNAQLLATVNSSGTTYHLRDHLSARVNTDLNGTITGQQGHYPFGEPWYASGTTTKWTFANFERDPESGNDYSTSRYYVSRLGRFASPVSTTGSPGEPQTLNRYSFAKDDPPNLHGLSGSGGLGGPAGDLGCPFWNCGCYPFICDCPRCPIVISVGCRPNPETCNGGIGIGIVIGLLQKLKIPKITCDEPGAKIGEISCLMFSAGSFERTCGYVGTCGLFIQLVGAVSKVQIASACNLPIGQIKKCPQPPKDLQAFVRTTFFGSIAVATRINIQSSAFK